MKFGTIVPQVNTHRLTESDCGYDIIFSRWQPWHNFTKKSSKTVAAMSFRTGRCSAWQMKIALSVCSMFIRAYVHFCKLFQNSCSFTLVIIVYFWSNFYFKNDFSKKIYLIIITYLQVMVGLVLARRLLLWQQMKFWCKRCFEQWTT